MITLKSESDIVKMQEAGKIHALVMQNLIENAQIGISTLQLNDIAESAIKKFGAKASFKGYRGFPASICASINEEVVHGIPAKNKILRSGDLLKLDLGVYYEGFHADAGRSVAIGSVSDRVYELINVTRKAFFVGLDKVLVGGKVNEIGRAVQKYVEAHKFSVVKELVGHGVGRNLHEDPEVPNFYRPDLKAVLKEGMALAIEPMVNVGTWKIQTLSDGWTVVTKDRSLSAYYEDTVIVTEEGPLVITNPLVS